VSGRGEPPARAFVALELDARVREAIGELQARVAPRLEGLRLTRAEGIHLTLRFLGPTTPEQLRQLGPALASAAAAVAPGVAQVRSLGTFPERGSPRVLWLGIEAPPQVLELQLACERAARRAGFEPEQRPFRPHLTLGRWRDHAPRPDLPETDLGATRFDTLVLYKSDLHRAGAVYTALQSFELGGG